MILIKEGREDNFLLVNVVSRYYILIDEMRIFLHFLSSNFLNNKFLDVIFF